MNNEQTLHRLLVWMAGYALVLIGIGWWCGKLADVMPIIENLVAAFSGAAFAIMRTSSGKKDDGA